MEGWMTSLDRKLASILGGSYTPEDFVIADAKDADMAFGVQAPGAVPGAAAPDDGAAPAFRTRPEYLQHMRDLVDQGVLDILLTSASNGEVLAGEGLFGRSEVTLAVRANDTTDVWFPRGSHYSHHPSRPFRTADLEQVRPFCDLVLYSVTFNNDVERDLATVEAYGRFRREAAAVGIRHFLEVFNPNAPRDLDHHEVGHFVNDWIVRLLAGVTKAHRPLFLKMAYNGQAALEELAGHDPSLVVGLLGGSAGTTRDTFELLHRGEQAGGRVSLFGRKIQRAESQLDLVALMPQVLQGKLSPEDAVRSYHQTLQEQGVAPARPLDDDLRITDPALRH
jgi:hypothetical protein